MRQHDPPWTVFDEKSYVFNPPLAMRRCRVCPHEESNLDLRLRRPTLYPLSYGDR